MFFLSLAFMQPILAYGGKNTVATYWSDKGKEKKNDCSPVNMNL